MTSMPHQESAPATDPVSYDAGGEEPLLLLGSASPARRQTLTAAGIAHSVLTVDLDEEALLSTLDGATPQEQVLMLAREKAHAVTSLSEGGYVVLGCDSMLEIDGAVVGKPYTTERAVERWRSMRGRTAILHSGHWMIDDRDPEDGGTGATFGDVASTEVTFADLSDEEIQRYVDTGEPLAVAGGFTIDGYGGPFVESIHGDPHTVVGLSLPLLRHLLAQIELSITDLWH